MSFLSGSKYSFRILVKSPLFALSVILTLAVGIGANTVMFSILSATIWRIFPYGKPDNIITLWESNPSEGASQFSVSAADFKDWRNGADAFDCMALYSFGTSVLATQDDSVRVDVGRVDGDFFSVLRVKPLSGRLLRPQDMGAGQNHVAVITDDLWRKDFGASPEIAGRPVTIDFEQYTIVGVLPPDFEFIHPVQIWLPLSMGKNSDSREARPYRAIGLLKNANDLQRAAVQLNTIAERLEADYPSSNKNWRVKLVPLREYLTRDLRKQLLILFGAVGFVLLVSCANVANLMMARMTARKKEIAVRVALGASRASVIAQTLTDSLVLSLVAGVAGVLLCIASFRGVQVLIAHSGFLLHSTIDWRLFVFAAGASLVASMIFGLVPALQAAHVNPDGALKEGGKSAEGNTLLRGRFRAIFTVAQVGVSMVLLLGAGLLIKSFWELQNVEPGFQSGNILTARISLSPKRYASPEQRAQFFDNLLGQVRRLPGVQSAAAVTSLPFSGSEMSFEFSTESSDIGRKSNGQARYHAVSSGYFDTIAVPLLQGRDFSDSDISGSLPTVIVNQALARQFFPAGNAIGSHLRIAYGNSESREIVGVIGDLKHRKLDEATAPEVYVSYQQNPWPFMTLVLQSSIGGNELVPALRTTARGIDPTQPLDQVRTMESLLSDSVGRPRMYAILAGAFGLLALMLASIGIYGVMAYAVSARTYEIGVRISLGASQRAILKQFLWEGLKQVLIGIALGLLGSMVLTRLIASMLYHVAPLDAGVALAGLAVLVITALLACYLPARRATRIDPLAAIRHE